MGGATGRWDGRVFCSGKKTQTVATRENVFSTSFAVICHMTLSMLVGGVWLIEGSLD